jgi:hypothetical protein
VNEIWFNRRRFYIPYIEAGKILHIEASNRLSNSNTTARSIVFNKNKLSDDYSAILWLIEIPALLVVSMVVLKLGKPLT